MNKGLYGYIYIVLIPTSEGNRFYVGQKKGNTVKETYWGSGIKVKDWFIKHTGHPSKCCDKNIAESLGVRRKIVGWARNRECLCSMEKIYVSLLLGKDVCWNMNIGGIGGSVKGRKLKKGRLFTEVHRQHLRQAALGRKVSEQTRKKLSEQRVGKKRRPMSEEAKQHISEAKKRKRGRLSALV